MDRVNYYFRQRVSESELDEGFDYAEQADWNLASDLGVLGIASGLTVAQQGTPNMTVALASGTAYDPTGRRIRVPSNQTVNLAVDYANVSTAVVTSGYERYLSIFVGFDRANTDARTDGNDNAVYFESAETFELRVVQGAEASSGTATKPPLDGTRVLLADVRLTYGQTTVVTASLSTTRRQDTFVVAGSPRALQRGTVEEGFSDLLGWYNAHVGGSADRHPATHIDYAGGTTWADGTTNPAATAEAQLDKVITDLRGTGGTAKIGGAATTATWQDATTIAAGTLASQVEGIVTALGGAGGAAKLGYAGGGTWADSSTNPATTVEAQFDKILTDLGGTSGALKVGSAANAGSPYALSAGTVRAQLLALQTAVNALAALSGGIVLTYTGMSGALANTDDIDLSTTGLVIDLVVYGVLAGGVMNFGGATHRAVYVTYVSGTNTIHVENQTGGAVTEVYLWGFNIT